MIHYFYGTLQVGIGQTLCSFEHVSCCLTNELFNNVEAYSIGSILPIMMFGRFLIGLWNVLKLCWNTAIMSKPFSLVSKVLLWSVMYSVMLKCHKYLAVNVLCDLCWFDTGSWFHMQTVFSTVLSLQYFCPFSHKILLVALALNWFRWHHA